MRGTGSTVVVLKKEEEAVNQWMQVAPENWGRSSADLQQGHGCQLCDCKELDSSDNPSEQGNRFSTRVSKSNAAC